MSDEKLATLIHALYCSKHHESDMLKYTEERCEGICYWYLEESLVNKWHEPDHLKWKDVLPGYLELLDVKDSKEGVRLMLKALEFVGMVKDLTDDHPGLLTIITDLLK